LWQLLLLLGSIGPTDAVDCGNCFYSEDVVTGYQNVICLGIPFTEIQNTFTAGNTGFVNINRFDIVPKIGDSQMPAGLLGIHKARIIHLASCGNNLMEIDRKFAMLSSRLLPPWKSLLSTIATLHLWCGHFWTVLLL
jgi:hypothetical protein